MPNIMLKTGDDKIFSVDMEIAKCSTTISKIVEDHSLEDHDKEIVPVPNVNGAIMRKIIQWMTYHKDDLPTEEEEEEKRTDNISSWDADFLRVDHGTLFELIRASTYLDIKGLLDATCKTVANMIKGKTPQEIRTIFNIENEFTVEEEEQIRRENEWCEDM